MVAWSTRNHLSFIRCMERVSSKTCRGWKFISNQQRSATSDVHQRTTSLLEQNNKRILNALTLPLTREKLLAKRYGNRRYQERNRLQNGQPQNYSQHHNEQSSIHYTESDFVEVKPDMGSARVIFGHMPFGQLPPAQVLTNQHPESIETIYITVIREPLTRIISHYNYLHPALSFRLWYKKHVQHQACNLQVAYLAGLHPSGPLNVNHNHCKAVHDYHVAHACYHLLRNISVVGIHEYHHEFEKTLLQTLGALDHEVAIALNSYHVTPLEHRHSIKQHSTSNNTFQHISLQDIDITTLEEMFHDNKRDVYLYMIVCAMLNKLPNLTNEEAMQSDTFSSMIPSKETQLFPHLTGLQHNNRSSSAMHLQAMYHKAMQSSVFQSLYRLLQN